MTEKSLDTSNSNSVLEKNKLIAFFMGADKADEDESFVWLPKFNGKRGKVSCHVNDLKYNASWNWLMPVVEKINKLVLTKQEQFDYLLFIRRYVADADIEKAYPHIIRLIEYYNQKGNIQFQ